ncbi:MAG TPA: YciI family protein [Polyangiales bacterium]|nr:YciI family protein [Polyangiales bacterium]
MSEFVLLFRSEEADYRAAMGTPELAQKSLQRWLVWLRELEAKGHLKDPGQPLERSGAIVTRDRSIVIDGPYAETKDLVLGFLVLEASGLEEAIAVAKTCPMAQGGGSVEVRPVLNSQLAVLSFERSV